MATAFFVMTSRRRGPSVTAPGAKSLRNPVKRASSLHPAPTVPTRDVASFIVVPPRQRHEIFASRLAARFTRTRSDCFADFVPWAVTLGVTAAPAARAAPWG